MRLVEALRKVLVLWGLVLLPVLFVADCLVLMQWDSQGRVGLRFLDYDRVFVSKAAFVVYGVLLAGVLGSYLQYLMVRFKADRTNLESTDSLADLGSQLLVGASAAFVAAILLPSALFAESAERLLGGSVNIWALLILGGAVGYRSRNVLGELAEVTSRLLAQIGQPFGAEVREQISQSVRSGVQDAMAPPKLINYDGFVVVNIVATDSRSQPNPAASTDTPFPSDGAALPVPGGGVINSDGVAKLSSGQRYLLEVLFTSSEPALTQISSSQPLFNHFPVEGGIAQSPIPFRLHLHF